MLEELRAQVLIIGAGPVGLTLAMDLAQRGIDVLVAEMRHRGEPPNVKCNHVSARTMEIFRRLGVSKAVRDAGLPDDYPNDVAHRTTVTGRELSRVRIPSRRDRYTARGGPDTWWPTPEPPHRVNQIFLEPILFAHAESTAGLRIRNRLRIDDVGQDENGAWATGVDLDTGRTLRIRCEYLVGCDGSRSMVRKKIGAKFQGTDAIVRVQSTYFRAPALLGLLKEPAAWVTFALNTRRCGNVYAIDGKETWLLHNQLRSDEADFDAVDRDWAIREILGVDTSFEYEVISKEDWVGRRLVADRFRVSRIFICGDSAHVWVPMAGYGMNAGIADAMNLGWQLAGHLNGWLTKSALAAYEAERLPITDQVSRFAMNHAVAMQREREGVPADIEAATAEGEASRKRFGQVLYDLNAQQYCCGGLNFGYFYEDSPLIAYDGESAPPYSMDEFKPSTVPGCRTPHVWLDDGRSLYDAMASLGDGYTLLRFNSSVNVTSLQQAASARGLPMPLLDVRAQQAGEVYDRALVICRPDQHVAWRSNASPADPLELIDRLRGAFRM
jgi:2-polyprenyl-6-methoxyphenol hydroxylase-like FAD-dependent oxidoreductase